MSLNQWEINSMLRRLESVLIALAEIASPVWGCQLQCHWVVGECGWERNWIAGPVVWNCRLLWEKSIALPRKIKSPLTSKMCYNMIGINNLYGQKKIQTSEKKFVLIVFLIILKFLTSSCTILFYDCFLAEII